jgi:F-type H+-transporting ATPase subunit b
MDALLNIMKALGVNETLVVQLGIFLVTFVIIRNLVFKPFYLAFEGRHKSTEGNEEQAEKIIAQALELESLYQKKARSLNADVKAIYDKARGEANLENERLLNEAKEKSRETLDKYRSQIQEEFNKAREGLIKEGPAIGATIAQKLLADEVR